jgi:hypothetical protein
VLGRRAERLLRPSCYPAAEGIAAEIDVVPADGEHLGDAASGEQKQADCCEHGRVFASSYSGKMELLVGLEAFNPGIPSIADDRATGQLILANELRDIRRRPVVQRRVGALRNLARLG